MNNATKTDIDKNHDFYRFYIKNNLLQSFLI